MVVVVVVVVIEGLGRAQEGYGSRPTLTPQLHGVLCTALALVGNAGLQLGDSPLEIRNGMLLRRARAGKVSLANLRGHQLDPAGERPCG